MLGIKRIDRKMPAGAIMLAIVAISAYFLGYFYNYFGIHEYQFLNWNHVESLVQNFAFENHVLLIEYFVVNFDVNLNSGPQYSVS